jgi:Transglutaminase-like superfamily
MSARAFTILRNVIALALVERLLPRVGLARTCAWLGLRHPGNPQTPERKQAIPRALLLSAERDTRTALRLTHLPDTCLRRAFGVGHLTRGYRPMLRLGVVSQSPFEAHAWLEYPDGTCWDPGGEPRPGQGLRAVEASA